MVIVFFFPINIKTLAQKSPGPSGPKESEKSLKECPRQSPRARPKESKRSRKLRSWTLFGLRGALFGDAGLLGTPFRTLFFGLFWALWAQRARRPLCQARGFPTFVLQFPGKMAARIATQAAIYRALRARNRKKVSERVLWGVWKKNISKNTRKSLKIRKNTQKGPKIDVFRLFRVFFAQKNPF